MKKIIFILLFIVTGFQIKASVFCDTLGIFPSRPGEDTLYFKTLPVINVYGFPPGVRSERDIDRYWRLVRDVKITLPYAKLTARILENVNDTLVFIKSEKAKKAFLKQQEKILFAEFEQPLRRLTFSQGRLLLKLIDRECSNTSYELVQLYRGSFSAFFWQTVARIFGANLKSNYDALGSDKLIEYVVQMVESGKV